MLAALPSFEQSALFTPWEKAAIKFAEVLAGDIGRFLTRRPMLAAPSWDECKVRYTGGQLQLRIAVQLTDGQAVISGQP